MVAHKSFFSLSQLYADEDDVDEGVADFDWKQYFAEVRVCFTFVGVCELCSGSSGCSLHTTTHVKVCFTFVEVCESSAVEAQVRLRWVGGLG